MTKTIIQRSDEIWAWSLRKHRKNECYSGFHEIRKLEDILNISGFQFSKEYEDGGMTIIFKHDNGKCVGKARENCYSEGVVMDLLEVYGLYGNKNIYGYISADQAFTMLLDSLDAYTRTQQIVA